MELRFYEENHRYISLSSDKEIISATRIPKYFCEPYDEEYWLTYCTFKEMVGPEVIRDARKKIGCDYFPLYMKPPEEIFEVLHKSVDKEEFNQARIDLSASWTKITEDGSAFHVEREEESLERGYEVNPWDGNKYEIPALVYESISTAEKLGCTNMSIVEDLKDLEDGFYPELLVWAEGKNYIFLGQVDKVFIQTIGDVRYVDTDDYKTNRKLGAKTAPTNFYPPLDHLPNSKIQKYELQASIYNFLLECSGFTPRHSRFTHYKNLDVNKAKAYETEYLRDEVYYMMKYLDKNYGKED